MIKPPRNEDDLRQAVENHLKIVLDEDIWEALKAEGYVGNCFDPSLKSKDLETQFLRLVDAASLALRLHTPRRPKFYREDSFRPTELEIVIALQVQEAKQHPDLVFLWQEVFRGRLAQSEEDETEFLITVCESSNWQVSLGGLHLFISNLAKEFSQKYGWTLSSARRFILTGQTPYVRKFRMTFNRNTPYLVMSTITIEANLMMNPKELAKAFGEFRRLLLRFHGMAESAKRKRPLSEKHHKLAEFAVQHQHLSAREAWEEWNRLFPDWAYSQLTNFQRDRKAALHRLFGAQESNPVKS
jgi:hypothetical protein